MALRCPQCSYDNSDDSEFCLRCGNRLGQSAASSAFSPSGNAPTGSLYPQSGPSGSGSQFSSSSLGGAGSQSSSSGPGGFGSQAGAYGAYGAGGFGPQSSSSGSGGSGSQAGAYGPGAPASVGVTTSQSPAQMGTLVSGAGQVSIRRAFAGYGTLITHHAWLLPGDATRAGAVLSTTLELLRQRFITNLRTSVEHLKERGVNIQGVTPMEEREYLKVQRGVTTVFIYIAPAGQDLYLSRSTNVIPAISSIRVVLFVLWVLAGLVIPSITAGSSASSYTGAANSSASTLSCLTGVFFWLPFILLAIRSAIHWLTERDFFVYLRSKNLTDFELDDVMLLERATDDSVHDAVKQCGLDADKITPPAQGYQSKRRVRAI